MKTLTKITEIKENEEFVTKLQLTNVTSEKQAISIINEWCKENNSYSENVAWEDEEKENIWYGRVCREEEI